MRRAEFTAKDNASVHHVTSRIVGDELLLGPREKGILQKMLWEVSDFCGVQILTYCILSNHFHVLVRVPASTASGQEISDEELLRRFRVLYPKPTKYQVAEFARLEKALQEGNEDVVVIRKRLLGRMHDLPEFIKTVKQRFSIWYNRNRGGRLGTLWMDRYKTMLVEGESHPLQIMAAYIDLNSVRAGLAENPKDYRWSGYGEAVSGSEPARQGLAAVWADQMTADAALNEHRSLMMGEVASPWMHQGRVIDRETAVNILNERKEPLPLPIVLRCRVPYFTDGGILGSSQFVNTCAEQWQADRKRKRPSKAVPVRGAPWGDLAVINEMRQVVFG
jgi:REP element-mobilizing transposase RayT